MPKPKINQASLPWLLEIDAYVRAHDMRGPHLLRHAAADALDAHAHRADLDELIRKRLLKIVRYADDEAPSDLSRDVCGSTWSVDLTDRAVRTFWPDRAVRGTVADRPPAA